MRTSSYLLKLVILTIAVGTIPVLVLGWYSYHYSSQSVLKHVEESNAQVLRQSQLRVEQTLQLIDYSTSQILGLPVVTHSIPIPLGVKDREMVKELYNVLSSIQTFELGVKDVYLYSLERDWLITNAGLNYYTQDDLKTKLRDLSDDIPHGSAWVSLPSTELQGSEGPITLDHALLSIKKWPINAVKPRGLICVVLPAQQLNQIIAGTSPSQRIFILDANRRIIADTDPSRVGTDLGDAAYVEKMMSEPSLSGVLQEEVDGEKASISYRTSDYNGWTYVSVMPTRALMQQAKAIGWTSIWISVIVLAATVSVALVGSRKMYSPVRKIYGALVDGKEGSGRKDELTAIRDRIEGILSDHSRLKFELEGQNQQLVELLVRKLLLNEAKGTKIRDRLKYYGFKQTEQWESMRVLLCRIDRLDTSRFTEKDHDLLLFAIGNIASEIIPGGERLPPIIIQDSVVIVVGTRGQSESSFKETVFRLASQAQASVKQYLQIEMSIGISRHFERWLDAGRGYEESKHALKYRARLGDEAILFIEDVQPDQRKEILYPKELGEALLDAIQSFDEAEARTALSSFMASLSEQNYDHNDYQFALMRLLMDLVRLLQDAGISTAALKIGEGSLFEELLALENVKDIEAWLESRIVTPGLRLLEEKRQKQFTSISQEVIRFIEEAFDTDLTLERCAARINYHPQYISRVFRQETGVSFTDYLSNYRLEMAKRWLTQTDMTVTEIALKLKYNNPANFIRYFRKMEGVTPGQYRERS